MTDVARPCLLDRDQVVSVDVVMMVNKGVKDYAKYKLVVGILVVIIIIVLYLIQHTT